MARSAAADAQALLTTATPLSAVMRRDPVSCGPDTSVRAALSTMRSHSIGSIVITTQDGAPVGILTLRDVLDRVALVDGILDQPIANVMSTGIIALPPDATVYDAVLAMMRHGVRHILAVDEGRLAGLVSEKDLFSLQRINMRQLADAIRNAQGLDRLVEFGAEVREHVRKLLSQGLAAEPLTQLIASLNDLLTQRIIDLEFRDPPSDGLRFCWIALGSEGRFEQTLYTDQDNGIIFDTDRGVDEARNVLLPRAQRINQALDRCGFPLCKGNIMAGNPAWCLSLEEWQRRFANWIDSGGPEALLHGAIFFDFRALHGDASLADALRQWLMRHARGTPRFLHQMAANALQRRPPLGWLRDFITSGDGDCRETIDLKLNGATLFTDAARIYSLASGIAHTNTCERLRQFGAFHGLSRLETEAWVDAFLFIQLLRLRRQHADSVAGRPLNNRINPDDLNALQRHTLKEALQQAKLLQKRLALDYRL